MRAAVTRDRGLMEVVAVPEPGAPGPGEVLVRPEAVGLCGSDFHYFTGDIGTIDDPSSLYPRIQGHEAAATILEVGEGCPAELAPGDACRPLAGLGLRSLLRVPHRARQCLREHQPRSACTPTARSRSSSSCPPPRSSRWGTRIPPSPP